MSARRNAFVFAAAVLVVLGLAALLRPHVVQRSIPGDGISFTSDYFLTDTHEGDLVAFGQTLTLDPESRVVGDASLVGQTVRVAGVVEGDLALLGDNLAIDATSAVSGNANLSGRNIVIAGQVSGDLFVTGASLTILPGAVLEGAFSACTGNVTDQRVGASPVSCSSTPVIDPFAELIALRSAALGENALPMQFASVQVLALVVVATLALMGSSVLAVTFFPRHISHIEEAMRARPRNFVGVGIAVYALGVGLFFALTFLLALFPPLGLLLVPVFILLGVLLFVFVATGTITLAVMLGDWLLRRFSRHPQPPLVAAVAGSLLLASLLGGISLLPFGVVASAALLGLFSSVGLGASLFTRIGTRPVGRTYFVQG